MSNSKAGSQNSLYEIDTSFYKSIKYYTGVLISPYPDQEGKRLQRQKILIFIYPIY